MKAVGYQTPGPVDRPDALLDVILRSPVPGPRDLLVKVKAVSVNPVDVKLRASAAPAGEEPKILGFDAAGIVEAVGTEVEHFKVGDEVFYAGDITRPGSYAEYQLVDERIVGRKPAKLDWGEAAALPLTTITAWEILFSRFGLPRDRDLSKGTLLVINGAGGVGSILIQLARKLTGLTILATASRPDTVEWVKKMGADFVIDYRQSIEEQLERLDIPMVDYVASLTATDQYLPLFPKIVAPQGHIAVIDDPASLDIAPLKRKAISVSWEFMFTRSMFRTADMIEQHRLLNEVSELVDAGALVTTLTNRLAPIDAATVREAHQLIEDSTSIGKTVIEGF
ncbi:zinc-binding alcohol dehydrogenase family protein [Novosphingobium sp.]|uniref:zinc-binding alcohol dehydrogenase family protein n=1 Tax=Novosphingobium sp. TaxID=1874826 RepID=UPI0031E06670